MKLKSLNSVAHNLCQMAVGWQNTELVQLVPLVTGRFQIDVLSGQSSLEGELLPRWAIGSALRDWLFAEVERLDIPPPEVTVARVNVRFEFAREAREPSFVVAHFDCTSELEASGRRFVGSFATEDSWTVGRP